MDCLALLCVCAEIIETHSCPCGYSPYLRKWALSWYTRLGVIPKYRCNLLDMAVPESNHSDNLRNPGVIKGQIKIYTYGIKDDSNFSVQHSTFIINNIDIKYYEKILCLYLYIWQL